jgi:NAD+ kinase
MAPNLDSFVIVPICPHTLSARPLVIPSGEKIQIKMSDCDKVKVIADGQNAVEVSCEIGIERYKNSAKLILLNNDDGGFYDILREKLLWGVKPVK